MPDVKVYHKDCNEQGLEDDSPEMVGGDKCFEDIEARTQSRYFTCPLCGIEIIVVLDWSPQ